jgi:hypothetical protein
MLKRYLFTLLLTLAIYNIPPLLYAARGVWYWVDAAAWSMLYIALVTTYPLRIKPFLITCELIAMSATLISCAQYELTLKSQWFYDNFGCIMRYCYCAELGVIIVGIINGVVTRVYDLRISTPDSDKIIDSSLLFSDQHL